MKKSAKWGAVLICVAGLAVFCYTGSMRTARENCGILTPARDGQEDPGEDLAQAVIEDSQVPLTPGPGTSEGEENPYISQVVALVNEERAKAGAAPLEKSDQVCMAAAIRVNEITSSFSHTRPDGNAYKTVLKENGIEYRNCGENIAFGYRTPEEVVSAWMTSEGHRANILDEKYDAIGVGYRKDSGGQGYWVQVFILKK